MSAADQTRYQPGQISTGLGVLPPLPPDPHEPGHPSNDGRNTAATYGVVMDDDSCRRILTPANGWKR